MKRWLLLLLLMMLAACGGAVEDEAVLVNDSAEGELQFVYSYAEW